MASQQPAAGRLALAALLILSAAAGLAAADPAAAAAAGGVGSEPRQVRFRPDGTFVIAQFADLHYSDDEERDAHSDQVQAAVLAAERPDLVAFSGDQVSGFAWSGAAGWYAQALRRLLRPVLEAAVPFATILGNHDGEADLDRRQILRLDRQLGANLSLTQQGPRYLTGASHYWLDVLEPQGQQVAARIWMLDSGNRGCDASPDGWGCVPAGVVAWVEEKAAQLPHVPSLAFIHIPLPQFLELWNEHPTWGSKGKSVACPLTDTGAFEAFKRVGIQAVYSGHDHSNDFLGTLDGVRLAYGRKTGAGSRGPRGAKGARIIRLRLGESAALSETWVRAEDGQRQAGDGLPTLPASKQRQARCSADNWFLQRLRNRSFVVALLACGAAAAALVATTAAVTVLAMRWRQRAAARRRKRAGAGAEESAELMRLREAP